MVMSRPVISTITCTYQRPHFLKTAIESLRRQTYPYLQIIVINNGNPPTSETVGYLTQLKSEDKRVVVIDYAENHYSVEDRQQMLDLMNRALHDVATGELVFLMNDDEFLADDYLEKMVKLFLDNPRCTSAAGLSVYVDSNGERYSGALEQALRHNTRPRYLPGHLMVMDFYLNETPTMWSSSCWVFVIQRDEYINAGGIQRGEHYASFYGVVPFGISGFDNTALLYNRDHGQQLNKHHKELGNDSGQTVMIALSNLKVEERWRQVVGDELATRVVRAIKDKTYAKMKIHADALFQKGLLFRKEKLKTALGQYQRCLMVNPESADVHRRIGDIKLILGKVEEARQSYLQSIALGGSRADLLAQVGVALYQQGRFAEAADSFLKAIDQNPAESSLRMKLGWVLLKQRRLGAALHSWRDGVLLSFQSSASSMLVGPVWCRKLIYALGVLMERATAVIGRTLGTLGSWSKRLRGKPTSV